MPTASQQQVNEYYFGATGPISFGRKQFYLSKELKHRSDHRKMMQNKWAAMTPEERAKRLEDERNWNANRYTDI